MASRKEVDRTTEHDDLGQQHDNQDKRGVIGSVMKAVQDTYENAREAVVGKRDPADHSDNTTTTEVVHVVGDENAVLPGEVRDISADKSRGVYDSKAGEYADHAAQKAKETKDATKEKTMEYADYAGEKAKEAKDRTMEKAGEYKDYAAEKTKEGKDATMNKMGEYKDYTAEKAKEGKDSAAADAAKRAMGYLGEKKEETKQKAAETTEAAKQKTAEAKDKTKEMVSGDEDEEARRRMEGVKVVEDKGGLGEEITWGRGNEGVIKTEETRTAAVAEKLKAADQMTGQTFNDVGPMDD